MSWHVLLAQAAAIAGLAALGVAYRRIAALHVARFGLVHENELLRIRRPVAWGCLSLAAAVLLVLHAPAPLPAPVPMPANSLVASAPAATPALPVAVAAGPLPAAAPEARTPAVPAAVAAAPVSPQWATVALRDGSMLYLRDQPGGTVQALLRQGESVRLLPQAPRRSDGREWRYVGSARGVEGWVDATFLRSAQL
ncbi:MAG TPA: hypothetical protein VM369_06540 [Candidatus Binatia bacterium]|nr:hypothetical protein [Candidatus Binatia bacterium]